MAEPMERTGTPMPEMAIEVRFFSPGARCLFLFAEKPDDPIQLPPDDVLQKLTVRLQGTVPGTRRAAPRTIDVPYRVDGRIGRVRPRILGLQPIRILMLEPISPLARLGEDRIRRQIKKSACVKEVHLIWPDGLRETYARRSGHQLVFSRVTSL